MSTRRKLRRVDSVISIIRIRQFFKKGRSRPESEVTRALRANSQTMDMPAENNERPPFSPVSGHKWGGLPAALYELRSTAQNALSDLYFATAEKLYRRLKSKQSSALSDCRTYPVVPHRRDNENVPKTFEQEHYSRKPSCVRPHNMSGIDWGSNSPARELPLRAGRPKSRSPLAGYKKRQSALCFHLHRPALPGGELFRSVREEKSFPQPYRAG